MFLSSKEQGLETFSASNLWSPELAHEPLTLKILNSFILITIKNFTLLTGFMSDKKVNSDLSAIYIGTKKANRGRFHFFRVTAATCSYCQMQTNCYYRLSIMVNLKN